MTAKGHLALALLPAIPLSTLFTCNEQFLFLGAVGFGALLPDIDEPNSYIGRKLFFIAELLKIIGLKHRTFTHYLILPLLLFILSLFLINIGKVAVLGLAFGIFMHDIGDMLTKGGIKGFFYPFMKNKTIRILPHREAFYTGSIQEYIIVFFIYMIDIYLVYKILNIDLSSLYLLNL
jgi:inner membrane protein